MSKCIALIKPYELLALAAAGKKFTLIDARPQDQFIRGHLPSAIQMDWEEYCEKPASPAREILLTPGYWGKLLDPHKKQIRREAGPQGRLHRRAGGSLRGRSPLQRSRRTHRLDVGLSRRARRAHPGRRH